MQMVAVRMKPRRKRPDAVHCPPLRQPKPVPDMIETAHLSREFICLPGEQIAELCDSRVSQFVRSRVIDSQSESAELVTGQHGVETQTRNASVAFKFIPNQVDG